MTIYHITHKTEYLYEAPASLCYNEVRMLPRSFAHALFTQRCLDTYAVVEPAWGDHSERIDFYGNRVLFYAIRQPHETMTLMVKSQVELAPYPGLEAIYLRDELLTRAPVNPPWESVRDQLQTTPDQRASAATLEAREFVMSSPLIPVTTELAAYAEPSFPPGRPLLDAAYEMMTRIHAEFAFMPGVTNIATPLRDVLAQRRGVCQDFAHLMIGCLRAQGLAARYVSGYIETLPPPGQEKLQGADASHAWCAVYLPDLGWIDFDPTNHLIAADQHITVGWGRDFADVTPLKGVFFGDGRHQLRVSVDVVRAG